MSNTSTFESFLFDAYVKRATPEDFVALFKAIYTGSEIGDTYEELIQNFYDIYGTAVSTRVVELILCEPDNAILYEALSIVKSASGSLAISGRVFDRLLSIRDEGQYSNVAENFLLGGGIDGSLYDVESWELILQFRYGQFPQIEPIIKRYNQVMVR